MEIIKMLDNTTEITSETTTSFSFHADDKLTFIVEQLADNSVTSKDASKLRKGLMAEFLTEFQAMERANVSLEAVKMYVFELNGWNFNIEDATTGKITKHIFGKNCSAPPVISTGFSQGKSYQANGLKFANAINWQKVVEGGKSIDKLADVKTQIKAMLKAASSIEDSPAQIEQLVNTLKSITDGL